MTFGLRPVPNPAHIEIRDGVRILTREGYAEAMRRYFDEAKREVVDRIIATDRDGFISVAMKRFDAVRDHYGPLDIDGTDWIAEGREEDADGLAYRALAIVRKRGL